MQLHGRCCGGGRMKAWALFFLLLLLPLLRIANVQRGFFTWFCPNMYPGPASIIGGILSYDGRSLVMKLSVWVVAHILIIGTYYVMYVCNTREEEALKLPLPVRTEHKNGQSVWLCGTLFFARHARLWKAYKYSTGVRVGLVWDCCECMIYVQFLWPHTRIKEVPSSTTTGWFAFRAQLTHSRQTTRASMKD